MNPVSGTTTASPAFGSVDTNPVWIHRCRLEVVPQKAGVKVNAAGAMMKVVKRLADGAAPGDPIKFTDIHGTVFSPGKPPKTDTFIQDFGVVSVSGKQPKVVLGFGLTSSTPFSTLKSRCDFSWMHQHGLYLRLHPLEFTQGLDTVLIGYWTLEHPRTYDEVELKTKTNFDFQIAWDDFLETASPKEKDSALKEFKPSQWIMDNELDIPMGLERATVKYHFAGAKKETSAIHVTIPRPALAFAKFLMDHAILKLQKLKNFVPFGMSKDDPRLFGSLLESHDDFMFTHRNIQIRNVTMSSGFYDSTDEQESMRDHIEGCSSIYRVYPDLKNNKVNISVTEATITDAISWLDSNLEGSPYTRYVSPRFTGYGSVYSGTNTSGASIKTGKYSAAFALREDDSVDASTIRSAKSVAQKPAWQRPTPITVICDLTDAAFPPLPAKPKNAHFSTLVTTTTQDHTTVTFDEATLDRRLDEAMAQFHREQSDKMDALEDRLNKDIQSLRVTLNATINTIVEKTMQAFGDHETSPFSTKADQLRLTASVEQNSATLAAIWAKLNNGPLPEDMSDALKSPPRKKSNVQDTSPADSSPQDGMDLDRPAALSAAAGGSK